MVKVGLVISTIILGVFSFVISNAYNYLALTSYKTSDSVSAGQWSLVGVEFFVVSFILAIGFIIHSRKK